MNREWVDKKIKDEEERRQKIIDSIVAEVKKYDFDEEEKILQYIQNKEYFDAELGIQVAIWDYFGDDWESIKESENKFNDLGLNEISKWRYNSPKIIYSRYLDSEEKYFSGTIIITDPCYIIRDGTDDWSRCYYGDDLEELGLETFLVADTIYGDWSCTTFDEDINEPIGEFCADAGLVGVFLLDEVLEYNPKFDSHITDKYAVTTIEDFEGTVQVIVKENNGDLSAHVVGHGKNKKTGKSINFITRQTGF